LPYEADYKVILHQIIKRRVDKNIPDELDFLISESDELNKIIGSIALKTKKNESPHFSLNP